MRFDIITIGSATVDHFADTDSELIRIDTRSHHEALIAFPLGSKLLMAFAQQAGAEHFAGPVLNGFRSEMRLATEELA